MEKKKDSSLDSRIDHIYKRLSSLKSDRSTLDSHVQEITNYFLPNKNNVTVETTPGEKKNQLLFDSTGIHSVELLAGALHGMLTNPSTYWFEFTTGVPELDKRDDVRIWLQKTSHVTHEILNASNFQTEIHEAYMDEVSIGTASMSVEEDKEYVVRFSTKHYRDCYLVENTKGFVDELFYCFRWTAKQILLEFGEKKCPKYVKDMVAENNETKIELVQVVGPNHEYSPGKKLSIKGKKFKSCVYIKCPNGEKAELSEEGFNTFPFVTPRWTKGTGETYGRSPAMTCLSDVKMLQDMMKEAIRAQQKSTNPPMLVPDDGIIGSLRLTPGGINHFRSGQGDFIKPLQTGANLVLDFQMMDNVRNRIRDCFYIDQLQLQEGPQMTATEVLQRTEEKIRLLGPILGRQQSELLRPLIERVFEIMLKRGFVPPIPKILSNRRISVRYRSMIAKSQLSTEANNIMRVFQAAAPFIQMDPASGDVIKADEGVRFVASLYGFPQEVLRTQDEIEALRSARQEAQQEAIEKEDEKNATEQVAKLTPTAKVMMEAENNA